MTHRRRGLFLTLLVATLVGLVGGRARAEEEASTCAAAHRAAQTDRRDHRLTAAKADLLACARPACPALIRGDCADWLVQVQAETPSIVIDARLGDDRAPPRARVLIDDRVVADVLDGKAVEIDPGEHVVRVEAQGLSPVEKRVVVLEGGKAQLVTITLAEAAASPAHGGSAEGVEARTTQDGSPERASAFVPLAVGGVGVLGVGLFAGFGVAGLSTKSDLDASGCSPRCDHGSVARMRRDFVVADVSLVVGLSALTVAGILFVLRSGSSAPAAALFRVSPRGVVW